MSQTTRQPGAGADEVVQPIRGDRGASIFGLRNFPVKAENPDLLASPYTDAGTVPNLKFPFAQARNRILTGGAALRKDKPIIVGSPLEHPQRETLPGEKP